MSDVRELWNEVIGDDAVTNAYGEGELVASGWGRITWAEWCEREMARVNAMVGRRVRIARGHGYMWLVWAK
jgi:hypothetical protein